MLKLCSSSIFIIIIISSSSIFIIQFRSIRMLHLLLHVLHARTRCIALLPLRNDLQRQLCHLLKYRHRRRKGRASLEFKEKYLQTRVLIQLRCFIPAFTSLFRSTNYAPIALVISLNHLYRSTHQTLSWPNTVVSNSKKRILTAGCAAGATTGKMPVPLNLPFCVRRAGIRTALHTVTRIRTRRVRSGPGTTTRAKSKA